MSLTKNQSGQGLYLAAYDTTLTPVAGKASDQANITGAWSKDGGAETAGFTTANPTNIGGGVYWQPLTQAETNGDQLSFRWVSSTTGIVIDPIFVSTSTAATTPPTAAAIATAVWQDTTPGDFTVSSSVGKGLFLSGAAPGTSGGLLKIGTSPLPASGTIAAATWDEINTGVTHNLANSTGKQLRSITAGTTDAIYPLSGTVNLTAAASTTATLDLLASNSSQAYQWNVLNILSGTGAGQSRIITNYTTGRVATVHKAWDTTPDTSSTFDITPTASVQVVSYIAGQDPATLVLNVAQSSHNTAGTIGYDIGLISSGVTVASTVDANIVQILGQTALATQQGLFDVRLAEVDGTASPVHHAGTLGSSTATLALQAVNVTNPSGGGVLIQGSGVSYGARIRGASGLEVISTANDALNIHCENVNSTAVRIQGGGPAILITTDLVDTTNSNAIEIGADGSGHAIALNGSNSGSTLFIAGPFETPGPVVLIDATTAISGVAGGPGVQINTGAGDGIQITAAGAGKKALLLVGAAVTDSFAIAAGAGSPIDIFDANGDVRVSALTASALADFFTINSTKVYSDAVSGSVVKEIATSAGGSDPWSTVLPGSYTGLQAGALAATAFLPDGTIASATSTTITLPATDSRGVAIPDDGSYANTCLFIPAGRGRTQYPILTTATGTARQYNIAPGTCPVQLDNTSQYLVNGTIGNAYNADGTIASATSTTVTLPTTNFSGMTIPDDERYAYIALRIVAGTGVGQIPILTSATGDPLTYNLKPGSCPVALDSTSQFQFAGSVTAELDMAQPVPLVNDVQTVGDALNVPVPPTVDMIATAVWQDDTTSDFTVVGSIGKFVKSLTTGGGSDPWATVLPGSYVAGTAGYILGNYLDVAVSTRSTYEGTDTPGILTLLSRISGPITINGGAVAIDWAHVLNPATVVNLANTTISPTQIVAGVSGNVGGNVTGTIGGLTTSALAQFFTVNTGKVYADAVAGSVVHEISANSVGSTLTASDVWSYATRTLTSLGAHAPVDWINADSIVDHALDGKGDWSTYAGGDSAGVTTLLTRIGGTITIVGGGVNVNLAQTLSSARALDSTADTSLTLNDALHCAVAVAAGQRVEDKIALTYVQKTPFTATVLRTFSIDSAAAPTRRT